jgi:hypothetical protein
MLEREKIVEGRGVVHVFLCVYALFCFPKNKSIA